MNIKVFSDNKARFYELNIVSAKLKAAMENLDDEMKEPSLNVDKVMNKIIFGKSEGSFHNCPPGYDNEGNVTPNQNF